MLNCHWTDFVSCVLNSSPGFIKAVLHQAFFRLSAACSIMLRSSCLHQPKLLLQSVMCALHKLLMRCCITSINSSSGTCCLTVPRTLCCGTLGVMQYVIAGPLITSSTIHLLVLQIMPLQLQHMTYNMLASPVVGEPIHLYSRPKTQVLILCNDNC